MALPEPTPGWAPDNAPPQVQIDQHLNAALDLGLPFVDTGGQPVRLGRYFDGQRPVVLVLGYSHCAQLCGTVMHGILQALLDTGLGAQDYRVVGVSIDPDESPSVAARQAAAYTSMAQALGRIGHPRQAAPWPPALDLLTAPRDSQSSGSSARLAGQLGFHYVPAPTLAAQASHVNADSSSPPAPNIAHAAGFIVLTPQGRVSRYFMGIAFAPKAVRAALIDAGHGAVGTLAERLILRCVHFDPSLGRHSASVMGFTRLVGMALLLGLGLWTWRHRYPSRKAKA
jgi:protein SCO1/2